MVKLIITSFDNNVIGSSNPKDMLPWSWQQKTDTKNFNEKTRGHVVIMGRKTREMLATPYHDRINIVMSKDENYMAEGWVVCHSTFEAIAFATANYPDKDIWIVGGSKTYHAFMQWVEEIHITWLHANMTYPDSVSHTLRIRKGKWTLNSHRSVAAIPSYDEHKSSMQILTKRTQPKIYKKTE